VKPLPFFPIGPTLSLAFVAASTIVETSCEVGFSETASNYSLLATTHQDHRGSDFN
jgi:hypothetical protein